MGRPKSNNPEELKYNLVRCPKCKELVRRFVPNGRRDMILGLGDTRAGSAHFHRCYVNSMKQEAPVYEPNEERYPIDDVREVLREFGF